MDKEHQVIMHAEAFGNGQDNQHLAPMVDGAKDNLKKIGQGEVDALSHGTQHRENNQLCKGLKRFG